MNESMKTANIDYQPNEVSIVSQRKSNRTEMTNYGNYGEITGRQNRKYAPLSKVKTQCMNKI